MDENAINHQNTAFQRLLVTNAKTAFGIDHALRAGMTAKQYRAQVPIRDYQSLLPYMGRIFKGEADVLFKGRPDYLGLSSGTVAGRKLIPLKKEQIESLVKISTRCFLEFLYHEKTIKPLLGKWFYLSNTISTENIHGIPSAYLSGLSHLHVPYVMSFARLPTLETNRIKNYSDRLPKMLEELAKNPVTMLSGTPPWLIDLIEKFARSRGCDPHLALRDLTCIGTGGAALKPYRKRFESLFPGKKMKFFELYVATEGFIGFRDRDSDETFKLYTNQDLWFEFVPADEIKRGLNAEKVTRHGLEEIVLGKEYAVLVTNASGLWSYAIGDTIRFTSLKPYRFLISGRIQHYLDRFGEHLTVDQVERAFDSLVQELKGEKFGEFTVSRGVDEMAYCLWIECGNPGDSLMKLSEIFDAKLQKENVMYENVRKNLITKCIEVKFLKPGFMTKFWIDHGKDPGQSKIPHIINDESVLSDLLKQA